MNNKPTLSITFSNDNLNEPIQQIDGVAALVGTGQQLTNLNKVIIVNSLKEAESVGITLSEEPFAYRQIKEFYQELGGTQRLYVLLVPAEITMAQMLDSTNINYANKLIKVGKGEISMLGVFRTPPPTYSGGNNYFDNDVSAALIASKMFAQAQNLNMNFFRGFIEGRIFNEASTNIISPFEFANDYFGVVVGGTKNDNSASIGLALGRRMKYAAHIKMGKVANGPLSSNSLYVGTKPLDEDGNTVIAAIPETKATASITITNKGVDGEVFWIYSQEPGNWNFLGSYTKVTADDTEAKVATAIKNAINDGTAQHGYTASVAGAIITITARTGLGATINNQSLYVGTNYNSTLAFTKTNFTGGVTAEPEKLFSISTLHDRGFISFVTYPGKAGYYFGIDNMANKSDFKFLARGCVVDAAAKIAADVYINELEGEVDTNPDGTIKEEEAKHFEDRYALRAKATLGSRVSDVAIVVDRTVNVITTSKTKAKIKVLPVGYNTYIELEIGLTAQS